MPNKQIEQGAAATATTAEQLERALMLIADYADFQAMHIEDEETAREYFKGGHTATLSYNFETKKYTLVSTIEAMEQNIIKASREIAQREGGAAV